MNTTKTMIKRLVVRASGPVLFVFGVMGLASIADLAYSNLDKLSTIAREYKHEYITELDKFDEYIRRDSIRRDSIYCTKNSGKYQELNRTD